MVLQQLVEVGQLKVTDCLIDDNNVVMQVSSIGIVQNGLVVQSSLFNRLRSVGFNQLSSFNWPRLLQLASFNCGT